MPRSKPVEIILFTIDLKKKMQKVRIEDYKCGMTTVLSGVKEYVLKILGRKCTQMLTLIILCWQNYGQFLFFILFLYYEK